MCLQQSAGTSPFVHLPVELVRRVFELAAHHSPTALSLCLVSKEVHRWVIPIVYHTVTIPVDLKTDRYSDHGELYIANAHLIKNLYLGYVNPDSINIEEYPILQNLVIRWNCLLRLRFIPSMARDVPTLTHLTVQYLDFVEFTDSLIFRNVTHLYFSNCMVPTFPMAPWRLPELPHLTHIVWGQGINTSNFLYGINFLLGLLKPLVNLRVIGIQYFSGQLTPRDVRSAIQASTFRNKHKVVMMAQHKFLDPKGWNAWFQGGENVWEVAERLLSRGEQCLVGEAENIWPKLY